MLNPWMLLGLAGLSLPIIIHLIQRQRLQPQPLATLAFLDREDVANAFAPVPRDPLQLLLRLVLLAVFVILMSRLYIGGQEVGPRSMAVVMDQSMSMQRAMPDGGSLFETHKSQLLELIDGMRPEDKMSLALVGDEVATSTGYLDDKQRLREIAEGFQVSDGGALALVPTVRDAVHQLRSRREVNACVLVFSDHQELNYLTYVEEIQQEDDGNPSLAFRAALDAGGVKLLLVDEPPPEQPNLSIDTAAFHPDRVYVGASSRLTAVVRNRSDQPQTSHVTVLESDREGQQRELSLEPGEAVHVDLVHRFDSPVDTAASVTIDDDALPGDNRFHLPMRMKDRRQVLLVAPPEEVQDGEPTGLELGYRGVDLLAYALNPGEALGQGTGTFIAVKRITPALLMRESLPIYSIVLLYGVTELSEQSTKDLKAFVESGGGVWIVPDAEMSPLGFNETYGPCLAGFSIGQRKDVDPVAALSRSEAALAHPLLLPLVREEWGGIDDIRLSSYFGLESMGSAETALVTEGGDPLAAVVPQGRGQFFVQLFDCDLKTNSLPRSTAFVPMVQQIASVLSQRGEVEPPEVIRVGQVLRMRLPELRNLEGGAMVSGPQTREFPLGGPEADEIRVVGLNRAGAYEVTHPRKQGGRRRWITVNPVEGESELKPLSEDAQARLFGKEHVARLPFSEISGQFTRRHEMTSLLVLLVMLAFAAEALLGAWQSRRGARRIKEGAA